MLRAIRQLPFHVEFVLVLAVAFGLFSFVSVVEFFTQVFPSVVDGQHTPFSSADAYSIVRYELFALGLIGTTLWLRGWNLARIDLNPTLGLTVLGCLLFAAHWVLYGVLFGVAEAIFPGVMTGASRASDALAVSSQLSLTAIIVLSVVNPLFEEWLVVGYVMHSLRGRRSVWFAINVSTAIRLVYHLYQGPFGVISIVPVGITFAWFYARYGKLWPLLVAHALMDLVPLLLMRGG